MRSIRAAHCFVQASEDGGGGCPLAFTPPRPRRYPMAGPTGSDEVAGRAVAQALVADLPKRSPIRAARMLRRPMRAPG